MVIDPRVQIGHVHPKAAGIDRALRFSTGVPGLELQQRPVGQAAFVSGAYHHHAGLNTWESAAAAPANRDPDS